MLHTKWNITNDIEWVFGDRVTICNICLPVIGTGDDPVVHYDIALIKMDQPVVFSDTIQPICLTTKEDDFKMGEHKFVAIGWGDVKDS